MTALYLFFWDIHIYTLHCLWATFQSVKFMNSKSQLPSSLTWIFFKCSDLQTDPYHMHLSWSNTYTAQCGTTDSVRRVQPWNNTSTNLVFNLNPSAVWQNPFTWSRQVNLHAAPRWMGCVNGGVESRLSAMLSVIQPHIRLGLRL